MYRVSLPNVTAHRTCTPLHEKHQATPYATFLDPTETGNIYSGMVMYKTGADTVAICDGSVSNIRPLGLAALDRNPVIDDITQIGLNLFTVWISAPDALFTITAPAFDTGQSYAVPTNGTRQLLYAGTAANSTKGLITTVSNGIAIAELWNVLSSTQIIIRLLQPGTTP